MLKKQSTLPRSFESEIALVIKDNPKDIAEDIAGLTSILDYDLRPGPTQQIHDTYYDLGDGGLRKRMITLRARNLDHTRLLSMKSDPKRIVGKGTRRREVEFPWSYKAVQRLARELKLEPQSDIIRRQLSVSKTLASIGLEVVQERLTKRMTRKIIPNKERRSTLAELSIDDVTYVDAVPKVRLFEIEIEAKAPRAMTRIRKIADTLQSNYPDFLMVWLHGKFVTGLAIRRLTKAGLLQGMLDHNRLRPEAFRLIDQTIKSSRL